MNADDFSPLTQALAAMLAKASPNERKKLAREIARDLRKSNLQRIRAQKIPMERHSPNEKPQRLPCCEE